MNFEFSLYENFIGLCYLEKEKENEKEKRERA